MEHSAPHTPNQGEDGLQAGDGTSNTSGSEQSSCAATPLPSKGARDNVAAAEVDADRSSPPKKAGGSGQVEKEPAAADAQPQTGPGGTEAGELQAGLSATDASSLGAPGAQTTHADKAAGRATASTSDPGAPEAKRAEAGPASDGATKSPDSPQAVDKASGDSSSASVATISAASSSASGLQDAAPAPASTTEPVPAVAESDIFIDPDLKDALEILRDPNLYKEYLAQLGAVTVWRWNSKGGRKAGEEKEKA